MPIQENITDLIRQCFSCRTYLEKPIQAEKRQKLQEFISSLPEGLFGGQAQFSFPCCQQPGQHNAWLSAKRLVLPK